MRKKIYLLSIAGYPNYGDELILKSWILWLHNNYADVEVVIDSIHKNSLYFMLEDDKGFNDKIVNDISLLVNNNYTTDYLPKKINRILRFLFRNRKVLKKFSQAMDIPLPLFFQKIENEIVGLSKIHDYSRFELFHIIGGGYLNAIWKWNLGLIASANCIQKDTPRAKIAITGAGLFPINNESVRLVKPILQNFEFAEARDKNSADAFDIEFGFDDAFLCIEDETSRYENSQRREIPDVMFCIQSDLSEVELVEKTILMARDKIVSLKKIGMSIGYVEALPHSDHYAFEKLSDLIDENNWFSAKECIKFGLPVKQNQKWFSTRFHHHLVAASAGAEGVAISYKPGYYDIKHKSLLDLGTGWNYFTPYSDDVILCDPKGNKYFPNRAKEISQIKQAKAFEIYNFKRKQEKIELVQCDNNIL